ncbi:MAG: zinc ABC transporter substrate-binding protein [Bryobacteraceae bacterium]|nr:zinc ABC transporter substrate-binding protein [Bryobacteraceae bacterium]
MRLSSLVLSFTLLAFLSCGGPAGDAPADGGKSKPLVMTTNYPLDYFAGRIGGELIDVRFPMEGHADPAFWAPDPETIESYQKADLILLNGATYEKWVDRVSLPPSKVIDTSAGFRDRYIPLEEAVTHSHGPEGQHSHGGTAFTTWLDPALAREQANAILGALKTALPAEAAALEGNFASLAQDLEALDRELQGAGGSGPMLASHPVYQYAARRYHWNLVSFHWEPDEPPSAAEWEKLRRALRKHPAKVMLWEAPPQPETEKRLKELGVTAIVFYPCATRPSEGDYLSVMRRNAERIKLSALK